MARTAFSGPDAAGERYADQGHNGARRDFHQNPSLWLRAITLARADSIGNRSLLAAARPRPNRSGPRINILGHQPVWGVIRDKANNVIMRSCLGDVDE